MSDTEKIVQILLHQLKDHQEYRYISVSELMHYAGVNQDQIEFMELFHIQDRMVSEAQKAGIILDYHEFDGSESGVPFNLPAVVTRTDGVTSAEFVWDSWELTTQEEISSVHTRVVHSEIQVRRYNGFGLVDSSIYRLDGQKKGRLLSLLSQGVNLWDKNDYSVPVDDGCHWELHLFSGRKRILRIEGTVELPPLGEEIRETIQAIAGEENGSYIF